MDYFEDLADFMNHHMDDPGWAKLIKGDFKKKFHYNCCVENLFQSF